MSIPNSKIQNENKEPLSEKREEKALRKFKQALRDLILLLRQSADVETVSLYWINHDRRQFVLETKDTSCSNTIFQDRISFEDSFLNDYKSIKESKSLEVGKQISELDLKHYYNKVPVRFIRLIPFINNGSTVALTVLESSNRETLDNVDAAVSAYIDAMSNLLHTFMELNDLYEQQKEWVDYEKSLETLDSRLNNIELLTRVINEMQQYVPGGGVTVLAHGMGSWCTIQNSLEAQNAPPIGLRLEENTIVSDALESGEPFFTIHFNSNPKRISMREPLSNGASLAIPLMLQDRRQIVIVAYDENPLIFKESNKHKLLNYARIAALKLAGSYNSSKNLEDVFTNSYEAFIPELMEQTVDAELERTQKGQNAYTWFGFVTVANLSSIRTRLRLDELKQMQKDIIHRINPSNFGISGIIGYHSDYVYSFIIQGNNNELLDQWIHDLNKKFSEPYLTNADQQIKIDITVGYLMVTEDKEDVHQIIQEAKAALSAAVKANKNAALGS
ncbi:MAG TPA: hypothetical protein VKA34_07030 [Balneolales bacterium]|nr:hypothetical protein [Balneolales bacterium]